LFADSRCHSFSYRAFILSQSAAPRSSSVKRPPLPEDWPVRKTAAAFLLASLAFAAFAAAPPAAVPAEWLKLIDQLGSEDEDVKRRLLFPFGGD
jgi:hypothetical protein